MRNCSNPNNSSPIPGKKKQEEEPEEEIPEEFRDLSIPMLTEKIQGLQYRLVKVAKERNYMQLENDMV